MLHALWGVGPEDRAKNSKKSKKHVQRTMRSNSCRCWPTCSRDTSRGAKARLMLLLIGCRHRSSFTGGLARAFGIREGQAEVWRRSFEPSRYPGRTLAAKELSTGPTTTTTTTTTATSQDGAQAPSKQQTGIMKMETRHLSGATRDAAREPLLMSLAAYRKSLSRPPTNTKMEDKHRLTQNWFHMTV